MGSKHRDLNGQGGEISRREFVYGAAVGAAALAIP